MIASSRGKGVPPATYSRIDGRLSIPSFVGPAETDQMSTHGMTKAMNVTHHSDSNSQINTRPTNAYAASFATWNGPSSPASPSATAITPASAGRSKGCFGGVATNGSASQTSASAAGSATNPTTTMSQFSGSSQRFSAQVA